MSKKNRQRGKDYEKWVASYFKGRRVGILGNEDVDLPCIGAECKERERLPAFIRKCMSQAVMNCPDNKLPVVFLHELNKMHEGDVVLMPLPVFEVMYASYLREKNGGK